MNKTRFACILLCLSPILLCYSPTPLSTPVQAVELIVENPGLVEIVEVEEGLTVPDGLAPGASQAGSHLSIYRDEPEVSVTAPLASSGSPTVSPATSPAAPAVQEEKEPSFVLPKGAVEMLDEEIISLEVFDIQSDDAIEFITEKFPYWAFGRIPQSVIESIGLDTRALGDTGRFYIPDVGINVAVYYGNEMNVGFSQSIVDEEDTAVFTPHMGGEPYVADHSTQGFSGIRSCTEGMLAYWKHVDRIDVFYCVGGCIGANDGTFIYDDAGQNCFYLNEGGLFTYTCNEDWQHVTIVFWQPMATIWF